MTVEEIKATTSMFDLVQQYGIRLHGTMASCPLHKDKTPSMKIYKDGFRCFSCNWNGDIFDFVRQMDNCSFKEAYLQLGGEYGKLTEERKRSIQKARAAMEERRRKQVEERKIMQKCIHDIDFYRAEIERWEPMSDRWCFCQNELQKALYKHGELASIPY